MFYGLNHIHLITKYLITHLNQTEYFQYNNKKEINITDEF